MLENLFDLVKQHAGSAIIDNPAIPNERNNEAVEAASSSIFDGLKNAASGGNISQLMSMFNGGTNDANNVVSKNIQGSFVQNLVHKFGLDQNQATGIATGLIPSVLQNLVSKTNDPNDNSFNLQGILNNIGGGNFDVQGLIGKFTGNNEGGGNGGIMDSLKGLFGK